MHIPAFMAMEPAKKDLAQDEKAQSLPKTDQPQPKKGRHQPVPQAHDHKAEQTNR
jgi:hypothetical protein